MQKTRDAARVEPDGKRAARGIDSAPQDSAGSGAAWRIVLSCAAGVENKAVAARQRVSSKRCGSGGRAMLNTAWTACWTRRGPGAAHDRRCARRCRDRQDPGERAGRCHPLEYTQDGARSGPVADGGLAHLARVRPAAAPAGDLQVRQRSVVRRKGANIVGLYLDPPLKAMGLCVDEKSQIQALDRTQPLHRSPPASPSGAPMTMRARARQRSSPRSTSPPARSSVSFTADTAAANSCSSWHHRSQRATAHGRPARDGQRRHSQDAHDQGLVRTQPEVPRSLHADFGVVAQSGRALVRHSDENYIRRGTHRSTRQLEQAIRNHLN